MSLEEEAAEAVRWVILDALKGILADTKTHGPLEASLLKVSDLIRPPDRWAYEFAVVISLIPKE